MSIQQPPALIQISRPRISDTERARLQRRARLLAWGGNAWHVAEFAIALAGIAVALLGLAVPALRWLYDYAWFVGFLVAGAAHFALMQRDPVAAFEEES